MDNNRLTITNNRSKRKIINIILTIIIIILLIGIAILLYKPEKEENKKTTTTTTTTTEITTTTVPVVVGTVNNQNNTFGYNYQLKGHNYKIFICNRETGARITGFKLIDRNAVLGETDRLIGVTVDKDAIDLSKYKDITIEIEEKRYIVKYDIRCD